MCESVSAQDNLKSPKNIFSQSGLPLPRFVSLAKDSANVRSGPGDKYPIKWVYNRQSMPLEVVLEFENWRKVRDFDGQEGWLFHSMLSGKRTAFVTGDEQAPLYERKFNENTSPSRISALFEPGVLVNIKECEGAWCFAEAEGFSGWIRRNFLWGVYENENFD